MKIRIIDGPPSTGITTRVEILKKRNIDEKVLYVPNFTRGYRYGNPFACSDDLSRTIEVAVTRFADILSQARDEGKELIVMDGSPITLRALGTIHGVKPDADALALLQELGRQYANRSQVQLMMPSSTYIYPADMKIFDPKNIVPLSKELRSAYLTRGFKPEPIAIERSPYA